MSLHQSSQRRKQLRRAKAAPGCSAWGEGAALHAGPQRTSLGNCGSCRQRSPPGQVSPRWQGQALGCSNKSAHAHAQEEVPQAWGRTCQAYRGDPGKLRPPLGCGDRSLHSMSVICGVPCLHCVASRLVPRCCAHFTDKEMEAERTSHKAAEPGIPVRRWLRALGQQLKEPGCCPGDGGQGSCAGGCAGLHQRAMWFGSLRAVSVAPFHRQEQ